MVPSTSCSCRYMASILLAGILLFLVAFVGSSGLQSEEEDDDDGKNDVNVGDIFKIKVPLKIKENEFVIAFPPTIEGAKIMAFKFCKEKASLIGVTDANFEANCLIPIGKYLGDMVAKHEAGVEIALPSLLREQPTPKELDSESVGSKDGSLISFDITIQNKVHKIHFNRNEDLVADVARNFCIGKLNEFGLKSTNDMHLCTEPIESSIQKTLKDIIDKENSGLSGIELRKRELEEKKRQFRERRASKGGIPNSNFDNKRSVPNSNSFSVPEDKTIKSSSQGTESIDQKKSNIDTESAKKRKEDFEKMAAKRKADLEATKKRMLASATTANTATATIATTAATTTTTTTIAAATTTATAATIISTAGSLNSISTQVADELKSHAFSSSLPTDSMTSVHLPVPTSSEPQILPINEVAVVEVFDYVSDQENSEISSDISPFDKRDHESISTRSSVDVDVSTDGNSQLNAVSSLDLQYTSVDTKSIIISPKSPNNNSFVDSATDSTAPEVSTTVTSVETEASIIDITVDSTIPDLELSNPASSYNNDINPSDNLGGSITKFIASDDEEKEKEVDKEEIGQSPTGTSPPPVELRNSIIQSTFTLIGVSYPIEIDLNRPARFSASLFCLANMKNFGISESNIQYCEDPVSSFVETIIHQNAIPIN